MSGTFARRYGLTLGAIAAFVLLVVTTLATAHTTDTTALSNAVAVGPLPHGALPRVPTGLTCRVARAATTGPTLALHGACTGSGASSAACNPGDDALAASVQMLLTDRRTLTVTVIVPDYPDPGHHDDADVFMQVSRHNGAQRWSARGTDVTVDAKGNLGIASTLTAEPGTQTSGTVRIRGRLVCANSG